MIFWNATDLRSATSTVSCFTPAAAKCSKPWRRCWDLRATSLAIPGRCCAVTEICHRRRRYLFWNARSGTEHAARFAGGIRSGFLRVLRRGGTVIEFGSVHFDSGAALLAFVTLQRIAELWWARQNERRLFAAGGAEYGRSHLVLIVFLHAAWLIGMWALAYDRPVEPRFLVIVVILQIGRFWVLATLGRRWTIRIIVVPGEKLVARGPYRWLH